ncbi:MAG: GLPGLI family protein [Neolewinella sp.]|jgi:GLPGLI family protein
MKLLLPVIIITLSLLSATSTSPSSEIIKIHGIVTYDYYIDTLQSEASLQQLKQEKPETYALYGESFRASNKYRDNLKFNLNFNEFSSLFQVNEQAGFSIDEDLEHTTAVIIATNARDRYFLNHKEKIRLTRASIENSPVNVVESYKKHTWTLTGNEKCVEGRKLLEATTPNITTDRNGDEAIHLVRVWYAPDLPFSFGPLGYDGLPGLIMELRFGPKFTSGFTAIEIDISKQEKAKPIRKPKATADITEGDFQRRILELRQQRGG